MKDLDYMAMAQFAKEWAPVIQLGMLIPGLISLWLLYYRIRASVRWNKINAHMQIFGSFPNTDNVSSLMAHLRRLGVREECIEKNETLNPEETQKVIEDEKARTSLKLLLNSAERLCIAVNSGAVDEEYAYSENCHEIVTYYTQFEPYITKRIQIRDDSELYSELKRTALRWKDRVDSRRSRRQREIAKINTKLEQSFSIKTRYP